MDRRRLLATVGTGGVALAAAALLDACSSGPSNGLDATATPTGSGSPAPAGPRAAAAALEQTLVAAVDAVLGHHPDLSARLAPVRAAHTAHVVALVGGTSTPAATPSGSGRPAAATASTALRELASRERAAAREHATSASLDTVGGPDARLIASLAAYAAAQDVALSGGAR